MDRASKIVYNAFKQAVGGVRLDLLERGWPMSLFEVLYLLLTIALVFIAYLAYRNTKSK